MKGWGFVGPPYQMAPRRLPGGALVVPDRCVNLFLEQASSDAPYTLRTVPGLRNFGTLPDRPGRAIFEINGRCFAVGGDKLCEIAANGTVTILGTVAMSGDPAGITSSGKRGNQLLVSSRGLLYTYNTLTGVFAQVIDPQVPASVISVGFVDGYFIAFTPDRWAVSALFDGTNWGGDEGQRAGAPEEIRNGLVDHELVWLYGSKQTEIWQDVAGSAILAPVAGAFIEYALAAPWALVRYADVVAWLGQNESGARSIVLVQGYNPRPVTTPAIATFLSSYASVADARLFTVTMDDHPLLVLTIPSQNATWVYDVSTQAFHEWLYFNSYTGEYEASRVNCHALAFGKHLGLDRETGAIHELTFDAYDNAGEPIRWARRALFPSNEGKTVFAHGLELGFQAGVGLATGQGVDPLLTLRYSNSYGALWGNDLSLSMGAKGKYETRVRWPALGSHRDGRVYEIAGSEPVPTTLTDAIVDATPGIH